MQGNDNRGSRRVVSTLRYFFLFIYIYSTDTPLTIILGYGTTTGFETHRLEPQITYVYGTGTRTMAAKNSRTLGHETQMLGMFIFLLSFYFYYIIFMIRLHVRESLRPQPQPLDVSTNASSSTSTRPTAPTHYLALNDNESGSSASQAHLVHFFSYFFPTLLIIYLLLDYE